jgi:hypothetical protein
MWILPRSAVELVWSRWSDVRARDTDKGWAADAKDCVRFWGACGEWCQGWRSGQREGWADVVGWFRGGRAAESVGGVVASKQQQQQ